MEVEATIKRVLTKRTFTTDNGQFTAQPLVLEAVEERKLSNGSISKYEHSFIAEMTGQKAEEFNLDAGTPVVVGLQFKANEMKDKRTNEGTGKYFQTVRITYLRVQQ